MFRLGAVDKAGECVDGLFVDADFQFDNVAFAVAVGLVVEGAVAAGDRLELVVEVGDDLVHREAVGEKEARDAHGFGFEELAALIHAEAHDGAEVLGGGHDVDLDPGLFDEVDVGDVGVAGGVVDLEGFAVVEGETVDDARGGGDDVEVELAGESLKDDLEVEQTEESAAEAEAEGEAALLLDMEGRVVELELVEIVAHLLVVRGVDGVDAGEDDRGDEFKARQGSGRGSFLESDGVADFDIRGVADIGDEEAHFAGAEDVGRFFIGGEDAYFGHFEALLIGHEADERFFSDLTAHDADVDHDAAVVVVVGVEDEGAEEVIFRLFRRRDDGEDTLEDRLDAKACFGGDFEGVRGVDADDVFDLFFHPFWVSGGQVDLVDHGENFEVADDGEVDVGERLRLDALHGVDDEQRSLTGG